MEIGQAILPGMEEQRSDFKGEQGTKVSDMRESELSVVVLFSTKRGTYKISTYVQLCQ